MFNELVFIEIPFQSPNTLIFLDRTQRELWITLWNHRVSRVKTNHSMTVAEKARESIAKYLYDMIKADAFCYYIDTNHSYGFSLCSRFGMNQRNFEALLLAANLPKRSDKFGVRSNKKNWSTFLTGYCFRVNSFCKLQVETKRIDIKPHIDGSKPNLEKRERFGVIQIGQLSSNPVNPNQLEFER